MDPAPLHHSNRCPLHFDLTQTAAGVVNHYQTHYNKQQAGELHVAMIYIRLKIYHAKHEQQRYHG